MKIFRISLILLCLSLVLACTKKSGVTPDDDDNHEQVDKSANLLAAGKSANDILSNDKFTKLKVEIAYVSGLRPSNAAMNEFVKYLKLHTFKEDIEMVFTELSSPLMETLSIREVADLESENRTVYTNGETLGIYIYFADAPAEDDDEELGLVTLGSVYRNTTMVIHAGTVRKLASRNIFIDVSDIETATINHEFGHLFGLVDLGTPPVNNHKDDDAKNHCNVDGCLMRAELQFRGSSGKSSIGIDKNELKSSCSISGVSVMNMLANKSAKGSVLAVPLDSECILDLQSNGGR